MTTQSTSARFTASLSVEARDCVFLGLVIALSVALYVSALGFYDDDWAFLGDLWFSKDQSLLGLFRTFNEGERQVRPMQVAYLPMLYWWFGLNPLGYHLVNGVVLVSGVLLFYWSLRELQPSRLLALAVPVVYGLLPHYSTDRFWYAAFMANLSMSLYFASLYCDLRTLRARSPHCWGWKLLSLASLLVSTMGYEMFIPLFFGNALIVAYRGRHSAGVASTPRRSRRQMAALVWSSIVILLLIGVFKRLMTTRLGQFQPSIDYAYNYLFRGAIRADFLEYAFGLPRIIWTILTDSSRPSVLALGATVACLVFVYLSRVSRQSTVHLPRVGDTFKGVAFGLLVYGLGYAVFVVAGNVGFTPTGASNRTSNAAAIGVAICLVAGSGCISILQRSRSARVPLFCLAISLICGGGFVITNTIASFWATAASQQRTILSDIRAAFPTLPRGSTLLLDGVCSHAGPAVIFHSHWDIKGALSIAYRDSTLKAAVVKAGLEIGEAGIFTPVTYRDRVFYPYEQLVVYNAAAKTAYPLPDAQTAHRYFTQFNPDYTSGCPADREGVGQPIW